MYPTKACHVFVTKAAVLSTHANTHVLYGFARRNSSIVLLGGFGSAYCSWTLYSV